MLEGAHLHGVSPQSILHIDVERASPGNLFLQRFQSGSRLGSGMQRDAPNLVTDLRPELSERASLVSVERRHR
jgi:hypothetical protein